MRGCVRHIALVASGLMLMCGFAACALDESGTQSDAGPDVSTQDVTIDQTNDVSQDAGPPDVDADATSDASDGNVPCVTIDASCLPNTVPEDAGWTLLGLSVDASSCAFSGSTFLTNVQLASGACNCGCSVVGDASCSGTVTYAGYTDPMCTTLAVDGSVPSGMGCVDLGDLAPDAGVAVQPPVASGVTCDASVTGSKAISATTLTTCEPLNCNDDYCGLKKKGYRLCIAHPGPATCPGSFILQLDAVGSASADCAGCGCWLTNTQCTGSVSTFGQEGCDGGVVTTVAAGAACSPLTSDTQSIGYTPNSPPVVGCTAAMVDAGTVTTVGSTVICCL